MAKDEGKSFVFFFFFLENLWRGSRSQGGNFGLFFWGIPISLAKLCRAAYLFIYLFLPLPEGREGCPDTAGALKGEENSWFEFSYLNLDSKSRNPAAPGSPWEPGGRQRRLQREFKHWHYTTYLFNPLFLSLAESRLPHFIHIFLSITFIRPQKWNPTRIPKTNAPLAQGNWLPQGLLEARSFGGFQKVSDICVRNKNSQV